MALTASRVRSTYESRVSFDTFDNRDATDFSFTLKSKHRHYTYTKRSRTFLCGTDQNDYSEFALQWLLDELVDDGDEVVCLRVVDKDSKINSDASVEEGRYRTEAHELMEHIKAKNKDDEKSISLILEFAVGKVQDTIQRMVRTFSLFSYPSILSISPSFQNQRQTVTSDQIAIYEPACLIVGTRGRSLGGIQGLLPGSVSKYCLQNSPVPVIVVRPTAKREKKKRKRLADPTRKNYMSILSKSGVGGPGSENLVVQQQQENIQQQQQQSADNDEAIEKEAIAVAQAIGIAPAIALTGISSYTSIPPGESSSVVGTPLTKVASAKSDYTSGPESPSPTGGLSPDDTMFASGGEGMRSPESETLESPELSDDEGNQEEGGGRENGTSAGREGAALRRMSGR